MKQKMVGGMRLVLQSPARRRTTARFQAPSPSLHLSNSLRLHKDVLARHLITNQQWRSISISSRSSWRLSELPWRVSTRYRATSTLTTTRRSTASCVMCNVATSGGSGRAACRASRMGAMPPPPPRPVSLGTHLVPSGWRACVC